MVSYMDYTSPSTQYTFDINKSPLFIKDHTHLLAIFNAPTPQVILGSDILKFTPSNIMAHTYCLDENQWNQMISPVKPSTYIGPYKDCNKVEEIIPNQNINQQPQYIEQYPQTRYAPWQYWG